MSNLKSLATALNEVTITIQKGEKVNYHETFMLDTTRDNFFEYNGTRYLVRPEDAMHYKPSFWAFDRRLAMFFDMHKTLASLFDWFGFRYRTSYELGFLYEEGIPEPITPVNSAGVDWALINAHLQGNTSIEGAAKDADDKLRGPKPLNINLILLIIVGIIAVVAVIAIVAFLFGGSAPAPPPQNITASVTPGGPP